MINLLILGMPIAGAFYQSVEFYVVCVVVAAAVIAAAVRPSSRGEVITHLLAGEIEPDDSFGIPRIEVSVRDDGTVVLTRYCIDMIGPEGAVSGVVSINGTDVTFEERTVPGLSGQSQRVKATFLMDFLAPSRYHFRYESEATSSMAVITLAVKPDVRIVRELTR